MNKTEEALAGLAAELERRFAGRLARPVEVSYGVIHLELSGRVALEEVEADFQVLRESESGFQGWRVQQVDSLLLLAPEPAN
jgi:hypothetical protein